jgi:hypothetical protein
MDATHDSGYSGVMAMPSPEKVAAFAAEMCRIVDAFKPLMEALATLQQAQEQATEESLQHPDNEDRRVVQQRREPWRRMKGKR